MKILKVLLILIAVACIGVALSYPIRYKIELDSNNNELEELSNMRRKVMAEQHIGVDAGEETPESTLTEPAPETTGEPAPEAPAQTEAAQPEPPAQPEGPEQPEAHRETNAAQPQPEAPAQTEVAAQPELPRETEPAQPPSDTVTQPPTDTATQPPSDTVTQPPADTVTQPPTDTATQPPSDAATQPPADMATQPPEQHAVTAPPVTPTPGFMDLLLDDAFISTPTPRATSTPTPTPSPSPSPTPDRTIRNGPSTYKDKQKVRLDENSILPELKDIYALNNDLVGWLYIEDTNIDYPVVQSEDRTFYLSHDFYGRSNANGQIILEDKCDPYTPSYNLVLSGHHMNSGAMFGRLGKYKDKAYWETHKIVEFDTLMARKRYVVFGAFYSADYNENEEGFRYSADIQYKLDADMWLDEIKANQVYDTGVDVRFGDEFITLTTCDHSRRYNGRFVVVARRIREGEKIL